MTGAYRNALAHVLWIGGATDSGKSTIARIIAGRHGLQVHHYDRHDRPQVEQLAQTIPRYRAFLDASLDECWVDPTPEDLLQRAWQAFRDRFPLVLEDLLALPREPMLCDRRQAVWHVPTEAFKQSSMARRGKPSFRDQVSDPDRATRNVFVRDMLLAGRIRTQAQARGLAVYEVDGSRPAEEMAVVIERHFEPFLRGR